MSAFVDGYTGKKSGLHVADNPFSLNHPGFARWRAGHKAARTGEFETEDDAAEVGVHSGRLVGGDTFGDEDDGHEGGFLTIKATS